MQCPKCGKKSLFDFASCPRCGWQPELEASPQPSATHTAEPKSGSLDGCAICGGLDGIASYFYHPQVSKRVYAQGNMRVTETQYASQQREMRLCASCIDRRTRKWFGISLAVFAGFLLLWIIVAASSGSEMTDFGVGFFIFSLFGMGSGLFLFGEQCLFASREEKGDRLAGEASHCESFKTRRGYLKLQQKQRN
jgi:hypothetical protein